MWAVIGGRQWLPQASDKKSYYSAKLLWKKSCALGRLWRHTSGANRQCPPVCRRFNCNVLVSILIQRGYFTPGPVTTWIANGLRECKSFHLESSHTGTFRLVRYSSFILISTSAKIMRKCTGALFVYSKIKKPRSAALSALVRFRTVQWIG